MKKQTLYEKITLQINQNRILKKKLKMLKQPRGRQEGENRNKKQREPTKQIITQQTNSDISIITLNPNGKYHTHYKCNDISRLKVKGQKIELLWETVLAVT